MANNTIIIKEIDSLTYIKNTQSDKHVYISHGSAGIGNVENVIASKLLDRNINVTIFDHFTKHNIKKLFWSDNPRYTDDHKLSVKKFSDVKFKYGKIKYHIGFSLGGYIGLSNSEYFIKNYCFYPGCLPLSSNLKNFNFSNTKIFVGTNDNWCIDTIDNFIKYVEFPPDVIYLDNCYHSFMSIGKDNIIQVIKFEFNNIFVSNDELESINFNIEHLKKKFKWKPILVRLRYDETAYQKYLDLILEDISNF